MDVVGTVWNLDFWHPEPLAAAGLVVAALLYATGVRRLRARGRSWPLAQSLMFAAGLVILTIATQSPLAALDTRLFSAHAIQHILLAMAAPPLLCLGAPITLLLQSVGRSWQVRLLTILHSRPVKALTFPVTSWMIFSGTLFILYFSGLYDLSLRNPLFHELVHIHFVASGFLFFSAVVAVDPHPWNMHHGLRMVYVGLTLPVHAFLALALMSAATPMSVDWYTLTTGRDVAEVLTDQRFGAALMWIASDMIAIGTVGVVVLQWIRDDERSAAREDRHLCVDQDVNR